MWQGIGFLAMVQARIYEIGSAICMGMDLAWDHLPPKYGEKGNFKALWDYTVDLLEVAARGAAVIKPNLAYFLALGPEGMKLLIELIKVAKSLGLIVILDAKFGDIGSTQVMYGVSAFEIFQAHACTVVPYLGPTVLPTADGKCPGWMQWFKQGATAIYTDLTSNPEGGVVQNLRLSFNQGSRLAENPFVYEEVAVKIREWNDDVRGQTNNLGGIGAVVGATQVDAALRLREIMGDYTFLLAPGMGVQGGPVITAAKIILTSNGQICGVPNSSRALTREPWKSHPEMEPKAAAALALKEHNDALNGAMTDLLGFNPYTKVV